jgi:hypothetical protein
MRSNPSGGYKWVLTIKDHFSKFLILEKLVDKSGVFGLRVGTMLNYVYIACIDCRHIWLQGLYRGMMFGRL